MPRLRISLRDIRTLLRQSSKREVACLLQLAPGRCAIIFGARRRPGCLATSILTDGRQEWRVNSDRSCSPIQNEDAQLGGMFSLTCRITGGVRGSDHGLRPAAGKRFHPVADPGQTSRLQLPKTKLWPKYRSAGCFWCTADFGKYSWVKRASTLAEYAG